MGYKRRRRDDQHYGGNARRENPVTARTARIRKGFAQIGEPSHLARELVARGLLQDISEVHSDQIPLVLQTLKAVIREQPHKIQYLAEICIRATAPFPLLALEMAHSEASQAISTNFGHFKVFFRFICALEPIISNKEVLVDTLSALLKTANDSEQPDQVRLEMYRCALLASIYLPSSIINSNIDLQDQFLNTMLPSTYTDEFEVFDKAFAPETVTPGQLLKQAAREVNSRNWDVRETVLANLLIPEPVEKDSTESVEPKESKESKEESKEATEGDNVSTEPKEGENEPKEADNEAKEVENESKEDVKEAEESKEEVEEVEEAKEEPKEEAKEVEESKEAKEPTTHLLRSIHLPSKIVPEQFTPSPARLFRSVDGISTIPENGSIASCLLDDVLTDCIRRMDFNRREVIRQLMVVDMFFSRELFAPPGAPVAALEGKYKIEDVALDAVFNQLFDLAYTAKLPHVYYHSLLIEACVLAPQDVAPVLGRALRFIFNHLEHIDVETIFTAIDWFAHHVSNFAFTWKWNEWTAALELPLNHPQQVFVRELLGKQVRLSYPQRIRDVVPDEFKPLVQDVPDVPDLMFLNESARLDSETLLSALRENSGVGEFLAEKAASPDLGYCLQDLLVACLSQLGSRSVTHAASYISRFEPLVKQYATNDEKIVDTVLSFWRLSPWIGGLVVKHYCDIRAVRIQTLVNYVASHNELLLTSFGWETLSHHPKEAIEALNLIKLTEPSESSESSEPDAQYGEWWSKGMIKAIKRRHGLYLADEEFKASQRNDEEGDLMDEIKAEHDPIHSKQDEPNQESEKKDQKKDQKEPEEKPEEEPEKKLEQNEPSNRDSEEQPEQESEQKSEQPEQKSEQAEQKSEEVDKMEN